MKAALGLFLAIIVAEVALAAIVVLPKEGQTWEQITADRLQCHELVTKQIGFDPTEKFRATGAPALAAESDEGGLFGGVKTREQRKREDQAREDRESKMAVYNQAVRVCMEQRGYTVL
ncbi:MAG: hypothetical protein ACREQW_14470 [Candidatus Binatia bacterium]